MRKKKLNILLFGILYKLMMLASGRLDNISSGGILYPRESETREVKSLDGMWNFRLSEDDPLQGFKEKWFTQDLVKVSNIENQSIDLRNVGLECENLFIGSKYQFENRKDINRSLN